MSEAKHTPGVWSAEHFTNTARVEISGGKLRLLKDVEGNILAFLPQWLDTESEAAEAKANARLIAAAPELLEALEEVVNSQDERFPVGSIDAQDKWATRRTNALNTARAAIAKATGTQ